MKPRRNICSNGFRVLCPRESPGFESCFHKLHEYPVQRSVLCVWRRVVAEMVAS